MHLLCSDLYLDMSRKGLRYSQWLRSYVLLRVSLLLIFYPGQSWQRLLFYYLLFYYFNLLLLQALRNIYSHTVYYRVRVWWIYIGFDILNLSLLDLFVSCRVLRRTMCGSIYRMLNQRRVYRRFHQLRHNASSVWYQVWQAGSGRRH